MNAFTLSRKKVSRSFSVKSMAHPLRVSFENRRRAYRIFGKVGDARKSAQRGFKKPLWLGTKSARLVAMNAPGKLETASATKRFQAKRDAILAAAADAINEQSAKGMTFADVARRVGLHPPPLTHSFNPKQKPP